MKGGRADGGQFTLSGAVPWMRINPMSGINLSEPGSRNWAMHRRHSFVPLLKATNKE
jgi:hypothetical protein